MNGVVLLEIPSGIGHKASDLACQQHLGKDVARVMVAHRSAALAYGKRKGRIVKHILALERDADGVVRRIFRLQALHLQRGHCHAGRAVEEEAVGKHLSVLGKKSGLVHTAYPLRRFKGEALVVPSERIEAEDLSFVTHCQPHCRGLYVCRKAAVHCPVCTLPHHVERGSA